MFGLVPRSFGYFVIQVYSSRLFKVQATLGVSKFWLRWLSYLEFVFEGSCFSLVFVLICYWQFSLCVGSPSRSVY